MTQNNGSGHLSNQIQLLEEENRRLRNKLAEDKKALERYKAILNSFEEWYYEINLKGELTYFSPSICKLTGYSENELQGKNYRDYTSPETAQKLFQIYNDIYLTGKPAELIGYEVLDKKGKKVYIEASVYLMRDPGGNPTGFQGFAHDMTDRKQAEAALLENEEKYRTILENMEDGYFEVDIAGNFTFYNQAMSNILGYQDDALIGINNRKYMDSENAQNVYNAFNHVYKTGESYKALDWELIRRDGTTCSVETSISLLKDKNGQTIGFKGIARDISERKQNAKALEESEERYRLLAENVSDNIWIFDIKTMRFSYISPSITGITGFTPDEAVKFQLEDILTPPSLAVATKILEKELSAVSKSIGLSRPVTLELEQYRKDGKTVWTEVSVRFIYDQENRPISILGVTRDISERKRLQNQLQKSQKMESLGLLAGSVAHDLNNVLSGIVSYPELILMNLPPDSKIRKPLETMRESGLRAAEIVQDLLTIARGVATINEPLNLNDVINEYLNSPEFNMIRKYYPRINVKSELDSCLLNVNASNIHIRKVIMNLVSNATESIIGSGSVVISTENRYLDRILKGYTEINKGEYAVLSVSDDGSGISSNDLERIFEPFYTKKEMGRSGTGLGLSVVWNVIQDHKGYIDVITNKKGTTFKLYFPITRNAIFKNDMPLSLKDFKGNGEEILVVDDVKSQREISCRILDALGYRSKAVSGGEEAVEYLKANTVDLILLDMIMDPGISGYETYKRIIEMHPGQKAIILSGFSETEDVKETLRLGASTYIKKPLTIDKIGLAIKEALTK